MEGKWSPQATNPSNSVLQHQLVNHSLGLKKRNRRPWFEPFAFGKPSILQNLNRFTISHNPLKTFIENLPAIQDTSLKGTWSVALWSLKKRGAREISSLEQSSKQKSRVMSNPNFAGRAELKAHILRKPLIFAMIDFLPTQPADLILNLFRPTIVCKSFFFFTTL